jgi:hypothetical protein
MNARSNAAEHGTAQAEGAPRPTFRTLAELMRMKLPRVEYMISPWLQSRSINMLWGWRGVGKTFTSLAIGLSVSAGLDFLGWTVPKARNVLYVDGEMDAAELRDKRLQKMLDAMEPETRALALENFALLHHSEFEFGIPDLADETKDGRKFIEEAARKHGAELIILDNLSCLMSGDEKDDQSWKPMQDWMQHLRRRGYTVIYLHHGTKPDKRGLSKQRGTSKREDILNTSIALQSPVGCPRGQFVWEFDKNRGFTPVDPFNLTIGNQDLWPHRVEPDTDEQEKDDLIRLLIQEGYSTKEIKSRAGVGSDRIKRISDELRAAVA